jgi:methionyl-tRNA formyltransferase
VRIVFWGTPDFAVPSFRALTEEGHDVVAVVTQRDRPAGRGRNLRPSPVKEAAQNDGIPVLDPERPRGEEFLMQLRALDADLSVVVAYGHILTPEVLEVPRLGSINVHASLLPELRGAAPIHWAIARGDARTGITIMRMAEGMDSGAILHQVEVPITATDTSTELTARLAATGAAALIEALALLELGQLEEREQDHESATFAPKVGRAVARIDWSGTAAEVARHVRAMDEIPGAWTLLDDKPIKLFRPLTESPAFGADPVWPDASAAQPGEVVDAVAGTGRGLGVATADGVVWFTEVQPPGKRRMKADAWLLGRAIEPGTRFE